MQALAVICGVVICFNNHYEFGWLAIFGLEKHKVEM
jgi:hypothetical protein